MYAVCKRLPLGLLLYGCKPLKPGVEGVAKACFGSETVRHGSMGSLSQRGGDWENRGSSPGRWALTAGRASMQYRPYSTKLAHVSQRLYGVLP